jgi:hypothetical protein
MNTQHLFGTEGPCDEGRLSSAESHIGPTDVRTARLDRVDEYEEWGIAQAESFAAFLAVIQAELFRTAVTLEDAMQQSFSRCRCGPDGIRAAHRPITQYLRALRQIEQNVRLELVLKKNRRPKHRIG